MINTGTKLIHAKIGAVIKNMNRNLKPAWEIRLETNIKYQ